MLTHIDHVTIAVRDVEAAAESLRKRFSFVVGKPRRDETTGLSSAIVPLLQGYLELLSPAPSPGSSRSRICDQLQTFLEAREGLFSFALRSSALDDDVARLRERGSALESPDKQEGSEGSWSTSFVDPVNPIEPFLIQPDPLSSDRLRQAGANQPFALRSIEEVTIVVQDVANALALYERDFGLTAARQMGRQAQIGVGGCRVMLVPSTIAALGTPIGLYSASLGTTDINAARSDIKGRMTEIQNAPFAWSVATELAPLEFFGSRVNLVPV